DVPGLRAGPDSQGSQETDHRHDAGDVDLRQRPRADACCDSQRDNLSRARGGSRYVFAVDLAKNPSTFDLGRPDVGAEYKGICRVEDGRFILHYRLACSDRPGSFDESGAYRDVYVRPKH